MNKNAYLDMHIAFKLTIPGVAQVGEDRDGSASEVVRISLRLLEEERQTPAPSRIDASRETAPDGR